MRVCVLAVFFVSLCSNSGYAAVTQKKNISDQEIIPGSTAIPSPGLNMCSPEPTPDIFMPDLEPSKGTFEETPTKKKSVGLPDAPQARPLGGTGAEECPPCPSECEQICFKGVCIKNGKTKCPDGSCVSDPAECKCSPPCDDCTEVCKVGKCEDSGKRKCFGKGAHKNEYCCSDPKTSQCYISKCPESNPGAPYCIEDCPEDQKQCLGSGTDGEKKHCCYNKNGGSCTRWPTSEQAAKACKKSPNSCACKRRPECRNCTPT